MSCTLLKDKITKDFIDRGIINPGNNKILNIPMFNLINGQHSEQARKTFKLSEEQSVFDNQAGVAVANEEYLTKLDKLVSPEIAHQERFEKDREAKSDLLQKITSSRRIEKAHEKFFSKLSHLEPAIAEPIESTATMEDKIERMQRVFDTEVVIDGEMEASGRLLAANHPLSIKAGKPVIVINPDLLFSDTVFHEYGHLYIDILGGLEDAVVSKAVEQLQGSSIWNEVATAYPELQEESLAKEVLATALGKRGNDIYTNPETESIWQQIKQALLQTLDRLFGGGYNTDALEQLATEMMSGNVRESNTQRFNTLIDQNSKLYIEEPNQAKIDSFFKYLKETYLLDEETHVYSNNEDGTKYHQSVSTFAKNLVVGKKNFSRKADWDKPYDATYKLTKNNYEMLFNETRLPFALDKALQNYFNGDLESSLLVSNSDPKTYWYNFYNKEIDSPDSLIVDAHEKIVSHLDMINEEAALIEKNRAIPAIMGTEVHAALENYIENGTQFPENMIDTKEEKMMSTIKSIIDKGKANGSKFFTEQVLFSESARKPGTADLIEITKDGKFRIYDFKTTDSLKNKFGQPKSDFELYIQPGYMNQLIIYSTILEEYGLTPANDHLNIMYVGVNRDEYNPDEAGSPIKVTDAFNKVISPSDPSFTNRFQEAKGKIISYFRNPHKLKEEYNIKSQEDIIDNLTLKIQRGIRDYKKLTDGYTGKFTSDTIKNNPELHRLEGDIEKLIGKNNGQIILKYVDNIRAALTNVYEQSRDDNAVLTPEYMKNVDYLLQVSSFLPEVKDFIQTNADEALLGDQDAIDLLKLINETEPVVQQVTNIHRETTKDLAIKSLVRNSNFMQGLFAERFEIEARNQNITDKEGIAKYVHDKMQESQTNDAVEQREFQYWNDLLTNGYTDIRYLEYLIADPGMNKSQFVQVVKNILDKVDNDVRIDLDRSIPEIVKWHAGLKFSTTGDPAKIWDEFIEVAKYKNLNDELVTYKHASVIPEFTSEYREVFLKHKYKLDYLNQEIGKAARDNKSDKVKELKERVEQQIVLRTEALSKASQNQVVHPSFAKLSEDKQEALRFIHKKLLKSDERLYTDPTKKLVMTTHDGSNIYNLPKMRKSNVEAAHDAKGMMNRFVSGIKDFWRPPADEDDLNMGQDEFDGGDPDDFKTKNTDIIGDTSYDVPVFYRQPLEDPTLQSFDIPTLLAMNEETTIAYTHHKMVEADLYMITSSLKNAKALKTDSLVSNNVVDKVNGKLPKSLKSDDDLTLKAVEASINNRFYKRSYHGTYSKWNYRGIKALEALSKGTSSLLLAGNFRSATMTGVQGTIYRFIEGVAGEHFSMSDVKNGSAKAYGDLHNMITDTQKQFPTSKTNLLLRRFGLETQYKALVNKFVQDNFVTKNMDEGMLFAMTSMAENMVTANLMYTLMGNIKVMNAKGEYINKNGDVVDKKAAMSLDEAYEVKDGVLELNKHMMYTERNLTHAFNDSLLGEKTIASTEISRYIRSIYADLYGQYNQDMKSVAEMHMLGKLAFSMRKWLPRGMHRRWRGITSVTDGLNFEDLRKEENLHKRFYSQDQQKFQEGYYTTGIRYAHATYKEWKDNSLALSAASSSVTSTMTTHELANLKRLASEGVVILASLAGALILASMAKIWGEEDDDDRNDKLYYLLYLIERIKMESMTFVNPGELITNIKNPAASLSVIAKLGYLFDSVFGFSFDDQGDMDWNINNKNERGLRKGQYKVMKNLHLIPGLKNINQMGGVLGVDTNDSIQDTYEYSIR